MRIWELTNNMKVVIYPVNIQEIISIGMFFRVGSRNEIEDTNGITHLLEHVISDRFINDSSKVGGRSNALTTKEYCCFFAKSSNNQFEAILRCFRRICDYLYDETDISKAKKTVINEMQGMDIEQSLDQQIFEEHLKGDTLQFLPIGNIKNIEKISAQGLYLHFENYMQPMNCVLSIVGSIEEDEGKNIVERIFGDWSRKKSNRTGLDDYIKYTPKKSSENKSRLITSNLKTSTVRILFDGVDRASNNKMAYSLFCNYLGGGTHSKLFELVRGKSSMAYNAFCVPQFFIGRGIIYLKIVGISETNSIVIDNISKFLFDLTNRKITCNELDVIKRSLTEDHIFKHETLSSKMTLLGQQLLMDGHVTTDKDIISSINHVTSTEVENVLSSILSGNITILLEESKNIGNRYFNRVFN